MTDAPRTSRLAIRHVTSYRWSEPVTYALQQLRLIPKSRPGQQVVDWVTDIDGGQIEVSFDDAHANTTQLVSVDSGRTDVTITAHGIVEVQDQAGVIGDQGGYMPLWMFLRPTDLTRRGSGTMALARDVREIEDPLDRLHALSAAIREAVGYDTGYVSGYLRMNDRDEQDATHAWAEAHLEGLGWVGFDISNGYSPDDRYVRVATGLDYSDAAPISGIRQGLGVESMDVKVTVSEA